MNGAPAFVLDASALLAYVQEEPGADYVEKALARQVAISAANWAEVLSKLAERGLDPDREARRMFAQGTLGNALVVLPLDEALARDIARLRLFTRSAGLSLGDRACLALARLFGVPVLTTDRAWEALRLGIKIQPIR